MQVAPFLQTCLTLLAILQGVRRLRGSSSSTLGHEILHNISLRSGEEDLGHRGSLLENWFSPSNSHLRTHWEILISTHSFYHGLLRKKCLFWLYSYFYHVLPCRYGLKQRVRLLSGLAQQHQINIDSPLKDLPFQHFMPTSIPVTCRSLSFCGNFT